MQTVTEIEDAIGRLPESDMFKLIERLENKAGDAWDSQFEKDVRGGRLDAVARKALKEHRAGRSSTFPEDAK